MDYRLGNLSLNNTMADHRMVYMTNHATDWCIDISSHNSVTYWMSCYIMSHVMIMKMSSVIMSQWMVFHLRNITTWWRLSWCRFSLVIMMVSIIVVIDFVMNIRCWFNFVCMCMIMNQFVVCMLMTIMMMMNWCMWYWIWCSPCFNNMRSWSFFLWKNSIVKDHEKV